MSMIKYMGKALLTVIIPIAFTVIVSITVSAMFAVIGSLMGQDTFQTCFQACIGNVAVLSTFVGMFATILYFAEKTS